MRRSVLLALLFAFVLVGWLASGQPVVQRWFAGGPPAVDMAVVEAAPVERALPRVRVVTSQAEPIGREIVIYGRAEPKREVTVRAETFGRITEVLVDKGERIEAGQPLLRLDAREREAMLAKAHALVEQRDLEFKAATQLGARGFQAETQVAGAAAALHEARAELRAREVELENTRVIAPFAGLVTDRMVEIGAYVEGSDPLLHVMELERFLITGEIAETQRRLLAVGMDVAVELADGQRRTGTLSFISADAEEATRTFRVEVLIANADAAVPAGMSATLRLNFADVDAHRVSAALLVLDATHRLGVKIVDDEDVARFVPVELVRADAEAVWLAGLPTEARLIVVGQGFVQDGQRVAPTAVDAANVAWNAGEDAPE